MPAHDSTITTIDELLALPEDGSRHELLDGAHLVTPAPSWRHQRAVIELCFELETALREHSKYALVVSPADLKLGTRTLVQPDLFVVPKNADIGTAIPVLVIEILSPATAAQDRGTKRRLYLDADIDEYWIVDLDARLVERWRRRETRPEIVHGSLEWSLDNDITVLIDLPKMFERIERFSEASS